MSCSRPQFETLRSPVKANIAGEGGNSHLAGDVDYASASEVAGAITSVPGGVGTMTIACLVRNTFVSAARREGFAYEKSL